MNEQELFELAKQAARELSYEYKIGNWSQFCDEFDWDSASEDDIAKRLMPFLKKALTSQKAPATVGLT